MEQGLRPRRIVVGVHGSDASITALRWAVREAELLEARLDVVCAWEYKAAWFASYAPHVGLAGWEEARERASIAVEQAVQNVLGPSPPVPVTVEVAEGLAARVLLERAAGAEFLVLGTAAGRAEEGIGPVARACLRRASCPVMIVRVNFWASAFSLMPRLQGHPGLLARRRRVR
jgi:nucleotide-binding universal stress UspA family protein